MREFDFRQIPKPSLDLEPEKWLDYANLDLEIGAGQGLHAIRYCQENPGRHLIAVERTHQRFHQLKRRLESHPKIQNLSVFHADAVAFAVHFLPDCCLERVFLLYPNPYPKPKQANLRWHNRPFIALLKKKMKGRAQLILATNIESYKDEATDQLQAIWKLRLEESFRLGNDCRPRTHFEKKYLLRGDSCWNLTFVKN